MARKRRTKRACACGAVYKAGPSSKPSVIEGLAGPDGTCSCPDTVPGLSQTVVLKNPRYRFKGRIGSSSDACKFVRNLGSSPQEQLLTLLLNNNNDVIGVTGVGRGGRSEALIDPPAVFQPAVAANATRLIVVHNHPSGDSSPSAHDVAATRRLIDGGKILNIMVLDHVIVGDRGQCQSLRDMGIIK